MVWFSNYSLSTKLKRKFLNFLNDKKNRNSINFRWKFNKKQYMKNLKFKISGELTNTDIIMSDSLWVGVYPGLNEQMINYMIESIHEFFKSN